MASWDELAAQIDGRLSPLDEVRKSCVRQLAKARKRNVICYYSGWLQNGTDSSDISISDNDVEGLMNAIHGLDRDKGLDLVLHTPGGDVAATEAIVSYIRDCFPNDVCAIVPQLAMSAGTMIACSCNEVLMGRQSSLGPTDPQFGGLPASGILDEFERAKAEVEENPASGAVWSQIIGKYHPTLLGECANALSMAESMVTDWLERYMFKGREDAGERSSKLAAALCDHKQSAMHGRHFSYLKLREFGMNVSLIEDDDAIQDAVLSLHHAYMITFQRNPVVKIIESSNGNAWVIGRSPRG